MKTTEKPHSGVFIKSIRDVKSALCRWDKVQLVAVVFRVEHLISWFN